MRIGLNISASPKAANAVDDLVAQTRAASEAGLSAVWLSQLMDVDALTALAVIGHEVEGIGLGTTVVPTYPRHPMSWPARRSPLRRLAATGWRSASACRIRS